MATSYNAQMYVAELRVSSYFYATDEIRSVIPNATAYELNKGYWCLLPSENQEDAGAHADLVFVMEYVCNTLKEAEEHALKVGRMLSAIFSAYAGYPLGSPQLRRIASTDFRGNLLSQHNYWYESKWHMLSAFNVQVEYQLNKYLNNVAAIDSQTRYKLLSAIYWYGLSVTSDDPTIGYVAAWNGVESIGGILDSKFHPNGSKAPCQLCRNVAGKKRKRAMAGLEHVFKYMKSDFMPDSLPVESKGLVLSELVEGFTFADAKGLRDDVVHGLQDIDVLAGQCSKVKRHLIHILNTSILIVIGPIADSWIPGHYERHPGGRISFKVSSSFTKVPYLGEWIQGLQTSTDAVGDSGATPYVATATFEWSLPQSVSEMIVSKSEELFRRDADIVDAQNESKLNTLSSWRDRPTEPVWE